jgi:predicted P-loop ATPase
VVEADAGSGSMNSTPTTLASLAPLPNWVAWQTIERRGAKDAKPTKIPYLTTTQEAKADAGKWLTRAAAEEVASALPMPHKQGGVGLELTTLPSGAATFGIDLDSCRNPETGAFDAWAEDTIARFDSYTEISPSQTGAKIFAQYDPADLPEFRKHMGNAEWGKSYKRGAGDHPPAIEPHFGHRFFAVTDDVLPDSTTEMRHVDATLILRLLQTDGPAFAGSAKPSKITKATNDSSRSGVAFRKGAALVRMGFTLEQMAEALEADPETAEWYREKGIPNSGRELKRIFEKATAAIQNAPEWLAKCLRSDSGAPIPVLANAMLALRDDPAFASLFSFDLMQCRTILSAPVPAVAIEHESQFSPRPVTDVDVTQLQERLQLSGLPRLGRDVMQQAIDARAYERSFHPVRDYLRALHWDGKPRIATWLHDYLGADDTEYTKGIGSKFLISMVARIEQPGCKCDYVMVLEGPQGARKSTACHILGGEWFSDSLPDLHHSDPVRLAMHLRGKWVIELAELSSIGKAEAEALKAFVTQTEERYTPKYGRNEVTEPRQCVFVGTTNRTAYLRDDTGGRRFWPVKVSKIDTGALQRDRDQLFAEACYYFSTGSTWWPDADFERQHIAPEQAARYEVDVWEEKIAGWLDNLHDNAEVILSKPGALPRCTVLMVALEALHLDAQRIGTSEQRRVIAALERLGWEKGKRTAHGQPYQPGPGAEARKTKRCEERERESGQAAGCSSVAV